MTLKAFITVGTYSRHDELQGKHITLAFMPVQPTKSLHIDKLDDLLPCKVIVEDIVYWEGSNVTVARVALTRQLLMLKQACEDAGWTYSDYTWVPHITLSYGGDNTAVYNHLIGAEVVIHTVSLRIKEYAKD